MKYLSVLCEDDEEKQPFCFHDNIQASSHPSLTLFCSSSTASNSFLMLALDSSTYLLRLSGFQHVADRTRHQGFPSCQTLFPKMVPESLFCRTFSCWNVHDSLDNMARGERPSERGPSGGLCTCWMTFSPDRLRGPRSISELGWGGGATWRRVTCLSVSLRADKVKLRAESCSCAPVSTCHGCPPLHAWSLQLHL